MQNMICEFRSPFGQKIPVPVHLRDLCIFKVQDAVGNLEFYVDTPSGAVFVGGWSRLHGAAWIEKNPIG